MKPRRWARLLFALVALLWAESGFAGDTGGDGLRIFRGSRQLLQTGCGTATLTTNAELRTGGTETLRYVALALTAARGARVTSLGVGLSARTSLRVWAASSRSLAAVNSLLDRGMQPPASWTPLLGNRQGVPGLAEYLLDLPLVLAPNQTVVVVIAAEDAFLQAARPAAGSAAEVTLTDSFLTVAGPAWIGGVTYSVTANCVPRSTRATAAIELEGYAPANFTDVHVAQFMVSMVYQAGLMSGFADPNAAVRANSMFLVGVNEAVVFKPGVSFIVYGDFPSQETTQEFGRQVQRLFDSTFASSFAGFLQQQGLPSVGRVAFTRVWHDEPALGDILPSGRFYAAITAAGAGEPLTRGGVAGVVIGCIVIGAMVVGLVYATTKQKPVAAPKKGTTRGDKLREEAERLQLEEIMGEAQSPDDETTPPRLAGPAPPSPLSFPLHSPPTPKAGMALKIGETPVWNEGNTPVKGPKPASNLGSLAEKKDY